MRENAKVRAPARSRLVRQVVNGREEMLPADPKEVVLIFRERRAASPAVRARRRMDAEAKRRGILY
jgi:hypothetical protein